MELTVKEILNMPNLRTVKVIAGKDGLNKCISNVIYGEIPVYNNIKGNEMVFSTGYLFRNKPVELKDIIHKFGELGISAMAIQLGRYIDELPNEVLQLADKLKIPILVVPEELGFEMINSIQAEIINNQTKRLEFSEKTLKLFTSKLALGGNIQNVIDHLSDILQKTIVYFDKYFDQHVLAARNSQFDIADLNTKDWRNTKKFFSVEMQSKTYGYIIFPDNEKDELFTDYEMIAIEHASTVIKLQVQKKISNQQIENNYRNEFIQELITDNVISPEELKRRAELYGWNLEKGRIAVIVQVDQQNAHCPEAKGITLKEEIFLETKKYYQKQFSHMIYGNYSDYIVILINGGDKDYNEFVDKLKQIGDELRDEIRKTYHVTLSIGIGMYSENIKEIYQSYSQAKKAIELGRIVYGNDHTTYYKELGIFNILEPVYQSQEAQKFCENQLGSIIAYDEKHEANLLETIKTLSDNDWSLKKSAEELFIHYNTIKYRVNKICDLLDLDLFSSEQKLSIAVALKLIQMNQ